VAGHFIADGQTLLPTIADTSPFRRAAAPDSTGARAQAGPARATRNVPKYAKRIIVAAPGRPDAWVKFAPPYCSQAFKFLPVCLAGRNRAVCFVILPMDHRSNTATALPRCGFLRAATQHRNFY